MGTIFIIGSYFFTGLGLCFILFKEYPKQRNKKYFKKST